MRLSVFLLTLIISFQCSALIGISPTPQLHSVFDNKPQSFYMPESYRTFAPEVATRYPPYQQGPNVSYRHKLAVGIAMIIGGSVMAAAGLILTIALIKEGSYFDDPNATFSAFFSVASILLLLGGAALIWSGTIVRKRNKGKD